MPVEFLTDAEATAYGRYTGVPSQADLDRASGALGLVVNCIFPDLPGGLRELRAPEAPGEEER